MAKISLRAYNRDIQELILHSHNDEAIAHCKYILKLFPKHIDTYRLLGQAYLESQRYSEATDILRRTLSVIPEDFISQVGMSVIREDEGNLDAAIWHMERAFEVQPSNATIQNELRRLYGRRDGVEPPKMRLTRGALVRMYARGELYPQAIAEIRSALAEDTPRPDLEVLLARMHYLLGQKPESIKICKRIIQKLPYCFEANRILAELLPETRAAEHTKTHKEVLNALDPYTIFIAEKAPTTEQIPENAVTLERLNYSPITNVDQQPEWATTIGADIGGESDEEAISWLPEGTPNIDFQAPDPNKEDWQLENKLDFAGDEEDSDRFLPLEMDLENENGTPPSLQSLMELNSREEETNGADMTEAENGDESIPDWMKEAGWDEGDGDSAGDKRPDGALEAPDKPAEETQLPDWLQAAKPDTGELSEQNSEIDQADSDQDIESITDDVLDTSPMPLLDFSDDEEIPDWLNSADLPERSEATHASSADEELEDTSMPVWLTEEPSMEAEGGEGIAPETQKETESEQDLSVIEETRSSPQTIEKSTEKDIPDWLEPPASKEDTYIGTELSAFLETQLPVKDSEADHQTNMETTEADIEKSEEGIAPADLDDDAGFAWLESLAAKQGADPETLFTVSDRKSEEIHESAQEEIEELESFLSDTQAGQEIEDTTDPVAFIAPSTGFNKEEEEDVLQPIEMNDDDSFAWLESLAANRGVDPETLFTSLEERSAAQPDEKAVPDQATSELEQANISKDDQSETAPINEVDKPTPSSGEDSDADKLIEISPEESPEQVQAMPDWITQADAISEDTPQEFEAALPDLIGQMEAISEDIPQELDTSLPVWIQGTDLLEDTAEVTHPDAPDASADIAASQISDEGILPGETQTDEDAELLPADLSVSQVDINHQEIQTDPDVISDSSISQEIRTIDAAGDLDDNLDADQQDIDSTPKTETSHESSEESLEPVLDYENAQKLLAAGNISDALTGYNDLIKSQTNLEHIIMDLEGALETHPVEPEIWGTLGYAYQYCDRIRDALEAYTKAEELLR